MEKYTILNQRKELKKNSHAVVRSHYMVLFFLTLVIILFGTEFSYIKDGWGENPLFGSSSKADKDDVGSILDSNTVLDEIMQGRLSRGEAVSEQLAGQIQEKGDTSKMLGRTRGVFSQIVNMFSSGQFYSSIARTLFTVVKSESIVGVIFTLISFCWYLFVFFCIRNMLCVIYRRILILVRVYENISHADLLHIAAVRKWFRASWVMFVKDIYQALWSVTIVGGFIKMYSYFAVPYIVAENPDIKAREAITLSRRMMNGHKMELFLYQLTLIGWHILGQITFGISEYAYGAAYRTSCETEFYVKVREEAIRNQTGDCALLNDQYMYQKAERILLYETYFDVVDEITQIHEQKMELTDSGRYLRTGSESGGALWHPRRSTMRLKAGNIRSGTIGYAWRGRRILSGSIRCGAGKSSQRKTRFHSLETTLYGPSSCCLSVSPSSDGRGRLLFTTCRPENSSTAELFLDHGFRSTDRAE